MAVLLLADGGLQADRLLGNFQNLPHPVGGHVHLLGNLLGGGVVAQLLEQLAGNPDHLVDGLHHVYRDADGAGLVGDGSGDGLTNPPGSVGGELEALHIVELLHRLDQAQVALLDQVQELHPPAHIPLGDGHHQAQIGLRQTLAGPLPLFDGLFQLLAQLVGDLFSRPLQLLQLLLGGGAGGHGLGQLHLLLRGEQVHLADLLQIHPHRIVGTEGVHQGVGIDDLLLGDLLHLLHRGLRCIGQIGDVVLPHRLNAQIFQGIVNFVHLVRTQLHVLQHVQQLGGGELSLLFAPLDELSQLFRPGNALHHLHDLDLAGLHAGLDVGRLLLLHQDHFPNRLFLFCAHFFSSIYAFFCCTCLCTASSSSLRCPAPPSLSSFSPRIRDM